MSLILNGTTTTGVYLNGVKCTEVYLNGTSVYKAIAYATTSANITGYISTDATNSTTFTVPSGTIYDGNTTARASDCVWVDNSNYSNIGSNFMVFNGASNPHISTVLGKSYILKIVFNIYSYGANTNASYIENTLGTSGLTTNTSSLYVDGALKSARWYAPSTNFTGQLIEFVLNMTITSGTSAIIYPTSFSSRSGAGYVCTEAKNIKISIEEI